MEGVYDELDKLKEEVENLKEECQTKAEQLEGLREAHNEQLIKFMESKSLIEEQVQQLDGKSEEITELRQICEDRKSSLIAKELFQKNFNSVNENLRVEYVEKIKRLEGETKELVLALDEATTRTQDCERKICAGNEESKGLKRLLLIEQKKCFEAEQKGKASEELKLRDDMILKLEEGSKNAQDQLKWKSEQFEHLEEAYKRLQDQFRLSKVEWETEKSELLEEICSLQSNLDSQTRISENLHSQLKMCNQSVSHEESKTKSLEVEMFKLGSHFENVVLECQEAKSKIENLLTLQRDKYTAELRNALGTKATFYNEMEHKVALPENSIDFSCALERSNCEFYKKIYETKPELPKSKYNEEKVKLYIEENQKVLKQEKESLLGILKERDEKIGNLQQQIIQLESVIAEKMEAIEALKQDKEKSYRIAENKDCSIENLQNEIACLKRESTTRELEVVIIARLDAQKAFEQEEERLLNIIKEKDKNIEDLCAQAMLLTQDLESAVVSSSSVVTEKQIEIDLLSEALEKAENLKRLETQEKDKTISELGKNIEDLWQKLKFQEASLLHSNEKVTKLEALLEAHKSTVKKLEDSMGNEKEHLEGLVDSLQHQNEFLLEDIKKLSLEKEDLLVQIEGACNWINDFSGKCVELMDILDKALQKSNKNEDAVDLVSDGFPISSTERKVISLSSSAKWVEESIDKRSPLTELNH